MYVYQIFYENTHLPLVTVSSEFKLQCYLKDYTNVDFNPYGFEFEKGKEDIKIIERESMDNLICLKEVIE